MNSTIYNTIKRTASVMAVAVLGFTAAQGQQPTQGALRLQYSTSKVVRTAGGDSLQVQLQARSPQGIGLQHVVVLYPEWVSADGKQRQTLPAIAVAGSQRYLAIQREQALSGKSANLPYIKDVTALFSAAQLANGEVRLEHSFPFEPWMAEGNIMVRERTYGCAGCEVKDNNANEDAGFAFKVNLPTFTERDYDFSLIVPQRVVKKVYSETIDSKVTFAVNKHELLTNFGNNAMELTKLDNFIRSNKGLKGTTLHEVSILGYASPEGDMEHNQKLSDERTRSLANYLATKYPHLKQAQNYTAKGMGEDWEGLRALVAESNLPAKEQVVAIIDKYKTDTEREADIKALDGGKVYATLLADLYPRLRRTSFTLRFDVRPYNDAELSEVYTTKPGLLSLYELTKLADLTQAQGKPVLPIYQKAYEVYPKDAVARINYANILLKDKRDADSALRVLQGLEQDPRAAFAMATAYNIKGDWRKAYKLLEQSAKMGHPAAAKAWTRISH